MNLKITSKLITLLVLIAVATGALYLTTSSHQRASGIHYYQGLLAYKFDNYSGAVRQFTKAVQKDPSNLMALYFVTLSKNQQAENSLQPVRDAHYFRESVFHGKELVDLGEEMEHKNLYLFYYVLALSHYNVNEYDSAAKAVLRGVDIMPDDYRLLVLTGRIFIKRKDYNTALAHLEEARKVKSMRAYEAHFYLGEAYEALGSKDNAYYHYDQCINSWPSKKMKQEALRRKTNIIAPRSAD